MLHTIAVDDYRKLFEIVRGVFKDVGHDVNSLTCFLVVEIPALQAPFYRFQHQLNCKAI